MAAGSLFLLIIFINVQVIANVNAQKEITTVPSDATNLQSSVLFFYICHGSILGRLFVHKLCHIYLILCFNILSICYWYSTQTAREWIKTLTNNPILNLFFSKRFLESWWFCTSLMRSVGLYIYLIFLFNILSRNLYVTGTYIAYEWIATYQIHLKNKTNSNARNKINTIQFLPVGQCKIDNKINMN